MKPLTWIRVAWHILCVPFMIVCIMWWDFRCQWLGWHHYVPTWHLVFGHSPAPLYWRYEEVCSNFYCRCINLGTSKSYRWTPEMGDGPYPLGPDGKEMRRPDGK